MVSMAGAAIGAGTAMARLGAANLRRSQRERIPSHLRSSSKSVDFACDYLCTQCGRMEPPGPAGEGPGERACPHCEEVSWADLREGGVVEGLMEHDEDRRDTLEQGSMFGGLVNLAIGVLFGFFFVMGVWSLGHSLIFGMQDIGPGDGVYISLLLFGAWVLFCGLVSAAMLIRASRETGATVRETHPTRWRYAHVPVGLLAARKTAMIDGEPVLEAPFTARPCLAYSVGVRIDDEEPEAAWSWSAVLQEIGAIRVDGSPGPERVFLDVEPTSLPRPKAGTPEAARIDRWLRQHGIDAERLGLELYETIVSPGDTVTLRKGKEGGVVLEAR